MTIKAAIACAAISIGFAGLTSAEARQGWTVIAQQTVDKGGDSDTIRITDNRKYKSVRVCVYGRPIRLNRFSVQFHNGGRQDLEVRSNFRPGSCSHAIDLKGERRNIDWIMLNYNRRPGEGTPLVRIQAM